MALFNITTLSGIKEECDFIPFKWSNNNVRLSSLLYQISELEIYYCDNNDLIDFKWSNNNKQLSNGVLKISQLQIPI